MTIIFKDLLVAGAVWLAALSAVEAAGKLGGSSGADHASAAPTCGYECPVLATEGPGSPGDDNGRSMASATGRSGQIPRHSGGSAAANGQSQGQKGGAVRYAGGRVGGGGDV
jgi:hypothetical protein